MFVELQTVLLCSVLEYISFQYFVQRAALYLARPVQIIKSLFALIDLCN